MDNLTKYVNEQSDPFYVKGRNLGFLLGTEKGMQEGLQKGNQEGVNKAQFQLVRNLLTETDFLDEKIARLTETTLEFVQEVRRQSGGN